MRAVSIHLRRLRADAEHIWRSGVRAVDPERIVARALRLRRGRLRVAGARIGLARRRLWVFGAGKAAPAMARGAEAVLGARIAGGVVIGSSPAEPPLRHIQALVGDHPTPGRRSQRSTAALLAAAERVGAGELVLFLLSGGASALLCAPAQGLSLADKTAVTHLLLRCGASIAEMNVVRRHLSEVKGGGLLRRFGHARLVTLALSDVPDGAPETIGSGPTAGDPGSFAEALAVLDRHALRWQVPAAVRQRLELGARGKLPETLKPDDPLLARARYRIVGDHRLALAAMRRAATRRGYRARILAQTVVGETRTAAYDHVRRLRASLSRSRGPLCLLSGGETTVVVRGDGRGGRNQEFALACVPELAGLGACGILAAGSDGRDGPTRAAGAWADSSTLERAGRRGLDPVVYLERNDSYGFFRRLGDAFVTGPTGTNVMDLRVLLGARRSSG
jgi:glycerate-2-kinase